MNEKSVNKFHLT